MRRSSGARWVTPRSVALTEVTAEQVVDADDESLTRVNGVPVAAAAEAEAATVKTRSSSGSPVSAEHCAVALTVFAKMAVADVTASGEADAASVMLMRSAAEVLALDAPDADAPNRRFALAEVCAEAWPLAVDTLALLLAVTETTASAAVVAPTKFLSLDCAWPVDAEHVVEQEIGLNRPIAVTAQVTSATPVNSMSDRPSSEPGKRVSLICPELIAWVI